MASLLYLALSAALLVVLSFWFSVEERKGTRVAGKLRGRMDITLERMYAHMHVVSTRYGSGWLLTELHRLVYACIKICVRGLELMKKGLTRLERRTVKQAQKIHDNRTVELKEKTSALSEVMAHKTASALTEKEKLIKKETSLEGRSHTHSH